MNGITRDSISLRGAGVVWISQPAKGHRFTLDSVLLADFCRIKPKERVLEPGAGTGIISVALAKKFPHTRFYPVELQEDLMELCEQNRIANGVRDNVITVRRDIRMLYRSIQPGSFDVIVTNPPYMKAGTGRMSPAAERRTARHDLLGKIEFWLDLGKFLKNGGRYAIVFPAARLGQLADLMRDRGLELKRLRLVHPYRDKRASLVLLEAVKSAGTGLEVLPPLFIHEPGGGYTNEVNDIYGIPAE